MTTSSNFATIFDVIVFRTNIYSDLGIEKLTEIHAGEKRILKANMDRDGIDNVLRMDHIRFDMITALPGDAGFECEELAV